jgi:gliding motility-associated lipoprotein GldD
MPTLIPFLAAVGFACSPPTPKPFGYLRIDPPEAGYILVTEPNLPFTFHISEAAELYHLNIIYPDYGATFFCDFLNDVGRLRQVEADCRHLVTLHTVERFSEHTFSDPEVSVHATLFLLDGNSPTPIRFYLTDSVSRIFHGALLYDTPPNADSLAPVTAFLTKDIIELIQSFRWR